MTNAQLSLPERAALLAMTSLVEEVTNKDLQTHYGFTIEAPTRARLVERGYIACHRSDSLPSRPFVHELTELGWRRARQELGAAPPAKANRGYRLLYGMINSLDRYMTRSNLTLADVFSAGAAEDLVTSAPQVAADERIRIAYGELSEKPGAQVGLRPLRESLADLRRADFDAALLRLVAEPRVRLEPEPKLRNLTKADRDAAIKVGGEDKHLLSIERP